MLLANPTAHGATTDPNPDFDDNKTNLDENSNDTLDKLQTMDVASPPPARANGRSRTWSGYFHRYRQGLTFRVGMLYDSAPEEDEKSPGVFGGVQFAFSTESLNDYEAGADLVSDGTGIIHGARRFIYSRTRFRPYSKLGVGLRIVPEDRLVTFLKLENYQARAAVGFEWLLSAPLSLRLEGEGAVTTHKFQASTSIGLVSAW